MRRILVLGGAFNPPTLAHEAMIARCLALPDFSEVWIMPSGDRIDKTIASASDQQRLDMLQVVRDKVFAGDPRLMITDFELRLPRPSATHATIAALEAAYPSIQFWFVFGADSYASMPNWPQGAELQKHLTRLVLFDRGDTRSIAHPSALHIALPHELRDISSTAARQAADPKRYVGAPVYQYIRRARLYGLAGA